jgi:hypothetical protein
LNVFEREVYRRILCPVFGNEKENWRILTNKEIYASVKKTSPRRYPYFGVVAGLVWSKDPESYAGSSVCYW